MARVALCVVDNLPTVPRPLLVPLQPLLHRLLLYILQQRPGLPDRMEEKVDRCMKINARGVPFAFLLRLDPR
ncbi:MAG: hypothetical protein O2780_13145 [Proteobacteria bacterium]|nr:hypothetical protein [Pseudomonadota bacterium]